MPNTLLGQGSTTITLPQPMIGDAVYLALNVSVIRMLDKTIRTHIKMPQVSYSWSYEVSPCFDLDPLRNFFIANRAKEITVQPWWTTNTGAAFAAYFTDNELVINEFAKHFIFTLNLTRRLAAYGDYI